MGIYSSAYGTDSEYDPDEPPAAFDAPNLPSTFAHGAKFFGELVGYNVFTERIGYKMPDTENVAPWSLELDYTKDAPNVHVGGRIDDQLQPPDYCAYTPPHKDSWEEGLQEIEDFDWLADKEDEQHADASDSKFQGEEGVEAASGRSADTLGPISQDKDLDLVNDDAAHLHGGTDSLTAQPDDRIQEAKALPPANGTASITKLTETIALPSSIKHVRSDSPIVDDHHVEAQDAMEIDDVSIAADAVHLDIGPETKDCVAAEQGTVPMPDLAVYQEEHVASDILGETEPDTGLDGNDRVKASTLTSAPASSCRDSLFVHEPGLEIRPQIAKAPEAPTKDPVVESELLAVPHPCNGCNDSEATYSVSEASDQPQTQDNEPKAHDQLQDDSAVQAQPATDTLRSPSGGLSEVPALPAHSHEDDPTSSKSPGALSRVEENDNRPWQAQLRNAADEGPSDGLSDLLHPGFCGRNVHSVKLPPAITNDEASIRAGSPLAAPLSIQELENSLTLPPLPFAPENNAVGSKRFKVTPAEASMTEENASATQLAHRSSKLLSPSKAKPANARAEDHVAAPDLENSRTTVLISESDLVEGNPSSDGQDTAKDLRSTTLLSSQTTMSVSEVLPIHSGKRSNPSKKTKDASETESDAPPKKKAMKSAPAELRASRRGKLSNALVETMDNFEHNRRGAINSKKDTAHADESITDESDNMILGSGTEIEQPDHENNNVDMEEHFSDVEAPVTHNKHIPTANNVLSTLRSRPKVSMREMDGLSPTKYRDRSSKAKRDTLPMSSQLFKSNTLDERISSAPALEQPESEYVSTFHVPIITGDIGGTFKVDEHLRAKPKATPAKTKKAKNIPVQAQGVMKAFAARSTKEQKTEPVEEEEYELFPASKIDTSKPIPLPELSPPPRFFANARRTTRSKKKVDKNEEVMPAVEENSVVKDAELDGEDLLSGISKHEDGRDHSEEENDDFEDAREIIEAPDENEEADDDYSDTPLPASKKLKLRNKSSMLGDKNVSQSKPRTSTRGPSIAPSIPARTTNKYGFKPLPSNPRTPRTRAGRKAAAVSTAPNPSVPKPAPAPKAKVPAKRKAKTVRSGAATEVEEEEQQISSAAQSKALAKSKAKGSTLLAAATPELPARRTRRASAMENETKLAQEEEEKQAKEQVRVETKAKLRRRN